jgi:hypothetical protein
MRPRKGRWRIRGGIALTRAWRRREAPRRRSCGRGRYRGCAPRQSAASPPTFSPSSRRSSGRTRWSSRRGQSGRPRPRARFTRSPPPSSRTELRVLDLRSIARRRRVDLTLAGGGGADGVLPPSASPTGIYAGNSRFWATAWIRFPVQTADAGYGLAQKAAEAPISARSGVCRPIWRIC